MTDIRVISVPSHQVKVTTFAPEGGEPTDADPARGHHFTAEVIGIPSKCIRRVEFDAYDYGTILGPRHMARVFYSEKARKKYDK